MSPVDKELYRAGLEAFAAGMTLRQIVEQLPDDADDEKNFSYSLGFIDGLLAKLRALG